MSDDLRAVGTYRHHDKRYYWADRFHVPDEDGDRFVGRYHVALRDGDRFSVQRNDGPHMQSWDRYGTEVTRAYSREEAETAVRRADAKYQALQNDDQLELEL